MFQQEIEKCRVFSGNVLKWIAVICMVIDHVSFALMEPVLRSGTLETEAFHTWYSVYMILRGIGRTAFPLFAFFLVEGFFHTHNKRKYASRLLLFALVSEIPFDYAFYGTLYWEHQNVYVVLLIGLLTIWLMETWKQWQINKGNGLLSVYAGQLLLLAAGCGIAELLHADYSAFGIILMGIFYFTYFFKREYACGLGYLSFIWEPWCFPAFLLLYMYNGKRGKQGKYFFYLFYPAHILVLCFIRYVLFA